VSDRDQHEGQQKEIERIERPTEKAGQKSAPLRSVERLEQSDRFHALVLAIAVVVGNR
jgi:hypothetical protein